MVLAIGKTNTKYYRCNRTLLHADGSSGSQQQDSRGLQTIAGERGRRMRHIHFCGDGDVVWRALLRKILAVFCHRSQTCYSHKQQWNYNLDEKAPPRPEARHIILATRSHV
jgi:hypothetical protein